MGSAVIAVCECGVYEQIMIGGGMFNFKTTCLFPCCCEKCNDIVTVNLLSEDKECPNCQNTDVTPYDDPKMNVTPGNELVAEWNMLNDIGRRLKLTNGSYWCPKCKKPKLRFQDGGIMWD